MLSLKKHQVHTSKKSAGQPSLLKMICKKLQKLMYFLNVGKYMQYHSVVAISPKNIHTSKKTIFMSKSPKTSKNRWQKTILLQVIVLKFGKGCTIHSFENAAPSLQLQLHQEGLDIRRRPQVLKQSGVRVTVVPDV